MSFQDVDILNIRQVKLEKIKFGLQEIVSECFIDSSVTIDQEINMYRIRLRGFLYGESVEKHTIKYPKDWWQALRERWFPRWVLNRWPVRYTVHHIDLVAVYRKFRPSLPNEDYRIWINKETGTE